MTTLALTAADAAAATAVLCAAFREYPVMRFVLGESDDYDRRLATPVGLFVSARGLRCEPCWRRSWRPRVRIEIPLAPLRLLR